MNEAAGPYGSAVSDIKRIPVFAKPPAGCLVVRQDGGDEVPERFLVIHLAQVAQLVHDDIVQHLRGCEV